MPSVSELLLYAVPAVILVGLAKGGFSGLGALGMPIMALGIDPVRGAAIMLPILLAQDVVGVWAFRRSWEPRVLRVMLPGAVLGVAAGYALAALVSERAVLAALGAISILFGGFRLWLERGGRAPQASGASAWSGRLFGVLTGFTSQIAHAGGPPFQMWVMPQRLPRDVFVGTSAIFFAVLNWIKVPAYLALGQVTVPNLIASAALLPIAVLASVAGVFLVRMVPVERFYPVIYTLMMVAGARLLWAGVVGPH